MSIPTQSKYEPKPVDNEVPSVWYKCRECTRVFPQREDLAGHRETHDTNSDSEVVMEEEEPSPSKNARKGKRKRSDSEASDEDSPKVVENDQENDSPSTSTGNLEEEPEASTSTKRKGSTKSPNSSALQCSVCSRKFSSRKDLKVHMNTHNTKREKSIHLGKKKRATNGFSSQDDDDEADTPYDGLPAATLKTPEKRKISWKNYPPGKKRFISAQSATSTRKR